MSESIIHEAQWGELQDAARKQEERDRKEAGRGREGDEGLRETETRDREGRGERGKETKRESRGRPQIDRSLESPWAVLGLSGGGPGTLSTLLGSPVAS